MLEKITKESIINNLNQFTNKEQEFIMDNIKFIQKIYLLGMLDSKL